MTKKLQKIFKDFGWSIHEANGCYENVKCYELENYSPAGEDLIVVLYGNNDNEVIQDFINYYDDFDPEAHALELVGCAGAPGIRYLLADADDIDSMLYDLKNRLEHYLEVRA